MPPCHRVISKLWMSSSSPHPPALSPLNNGWHLNENNQNEILWYYGESCPNKLDAVIENSSDDTFDEYNEEGKCLFSPPFEIFLQYFDWVNI